MSENKKKKFRHAKEGHKIDVDKEEIKIDENSPVIKLFRECQHELDSRYDKHERIVKLSRDITIESKRTIFLLHRVDISADSDEILHQAEEKLQVIENSKFRDIAKELVATDPYQFLRAYTAGLQEYIEALTFYFYLKDHKLINLTDVQKRLTFSHAGETQTGNKEKGTSEAVKSDVNEQIKGNNPEGTHGTSKSEADMKLSTATVSVTVPPEEFILGIADLTGELMRRAINSVGSGDLDQPFKICSFLQEIEAACVTIGFASRELNRKIYTLRQSLRKVETACYTLRVRGSEIPKHMLVDALSKATVTSYIEDAIMSEDN